MSVVHIDNTLVVEDVVFPQYSGLYLLNAQQSGEIYRILFNPHRNDDIRDWMDANHLEPV